jgi:integrase
MEYNPMSTIKSKKKDPIASPPTTPTKYSLADVLVALGGQKTKALSETRRRDLRSSIKRVALLLRDDPVRIPLELPAISVKLATITPAASGMTSKTFANIRANFMAAVKASRLKTFQSPLKAPLSPGWKKLFGKLSAKRAHIGLSRLARYASAEGIDPKEINDSTIEAFIARVRNGTLHRKPNHLHRKVARIWNEVAQRSELGLKAVNVPSFRSPVKRIDWKLLPKTFRKDLHQYLTWCASDPLAIDARSRPLAPRTIKLRENQVRAAVTALAETGVAAAAIKSLAELTSAENFKRILRRRYEMVEGRENVFNHDLARSLVEIARQWVKVDAATLAELRRLAGKVPTPLAGLAERNKRALRQFDDPAILRRLYDFPARLWTEVKRDPKPDLRTLVKAQAALAVGILSFMPLRLQNLASLTFDVHLFIHEAPDATSSLEFPASEVKNRREVAFDIPPLLARMLIEYRNRIAPKIIGRRPDKLFVKADGTPKNQWSVGWLISTYLKKRTGIRLSSHQFRHLSALVILDAEPGNFEVVRQLLGHASLRATVNAYTGISTRRAARHHQHLIGKALAPEKLVGRKRNKRPDDLDRRFL